MCTGLTRSSLQPLACRSLYLCLHLRSLLAACRHPDLDLDRDLNLR